MNDLMQFTQTERQREILEAVIKCGSNKKAAVSLGMNRRSVDQAIERIKKQAAHQKVRFSRKAVEKAPTPNKIGAMKIFVLPDVQAKPGVDFTFLSRIGQYVVDKRPDVIVAIGDFADMESLSAYDKGKKSFEGRRFKKDIEAAKDAMCAFLTPIWEYNDTHKDNPYRPRMVMTLGNHEDRINRAINNDPMLAGLLSTDLLGYKEDGWEVYDFLEVVSIEGVAFSHFFQTGVMGRPASSAQAQLNKKHQSCIAGHQQGLHIASGFRADGAMIWSIILGSCYEHDESYMGPQGNKHWRGCMMLHDVKDGTFDPMFVSLSYLEKRYPDVKLGEYVQRGEPVLI